MTNSLLVIERVKIEEIIDSNLLLYSFGSTVLGSLALNKV